MPTYEACIARAEEAERLLALVSYDRDRVRLARQAAEWRERAAATLAAVDVPADAKPPVPSLWSRVRATLDRGRRA